jgi:hypothetical protein
MMILVKARNLSECLKGKYPEGVRAFAASTDRLHSLKNVYVFLLLKCLEKLLVEMLRQPSNFWSICK